MKWKRRFVRLVWGPALGLGLAAGLLAQSKATVIRVPITGTIDLGLGPFVKRSLDAAAQSGARLVVLDINTPGGRIDAAWQIVDAVQDSKVPVYAYVDRALSAGALIALSTKGVYMRPAATLGAATPVTGEGQKASEKVVSAMRSEFRALAESRGLDPKVGEAMVDEDVEIPGVVERGKLLTLTADEAVRLRYAEGVEPNLEDMLTAVGEPGAAVVTVEPNWAESLVRFLTNPIVAPLLLSLGFLGLLFEIKTAGFGFGGLVGLAALALFFGAHLIVGLAGMEELILMGAGLVLIGLEIFVIPGFGVAGALGILALGAGIVLTMLGRFPTLNDLATALTVLAASMLIAAALAFALLRHLPWSRGLRGIFLQESTSKATGYISADARADLVGQMGRAVTALRPSGVGLFGEERLDVVSEGGWIEAGDPIEVVRSEGYRHVVRRAPGAA